MLILLWLACSDPALTRIESALDAYDKGRAALEAGRNKDAIAAFREARTVDSNGSTLALWEARALAADGQVAEAEALLTAQLQQNPTIALAWYNRAAYRVRLGRTIDAAQDLQKALELGATSPLQAAADPDFQPVLTDPIFSAFLPAQPLVASVKGPAGAVFVGSQVELSFSLVTLPDRPPTLARQGGDPGCLRLQRIVEDRLDHGGMEVRALTLAFRAEGPCVADLGPFQVQSGAATVVLTPVSIQVEAPLGAAGAQGLPALPTDIPLPGALGDELFSTLALPPGLIAMGPPDRQISAEKQRPDVAMELRAGGQTRRKGGWWWSAPARLSADGWEWLRE